MKRIFIIFTAVASSLLLASCSQSVLDIPQKGVLPIEKFYNTDADAESALNAMYTQYAIDLGTTDYPAGNYIPWYALFNVCGDDFLAAGGQYGSSDFYGELNEFRYDSQQTMVALVYKRYYHLIYYTNLIIDNFKDGTSETMKRAVAEAKVLRAYCHMMLAIGWGAAPKVDHLLGMDELVGNYEGGQKGLLEWAAQECESAVADLTERKSTADKDGAVKITKGAAWTIAGKAYLFAGNYAKAKENLANVINSGKYDLVPGEKWLSNFHKSGDGSPEKILEVNFVDNSALTRYALEARSKWQMLQSWNWGSSSRLAGNLQDVWLAVAGWSCCAIQQDYAQAFLDNDGDSYRRKSTFYTPDEFLYEMLWYKGSDALSQEEAAKDPNRGIKHVDGMYGQGLYISRKNMPLKEDTDHASGAFGFTNVLIFRYAEVLLMYAEAAAMDGDDNGLGLWCLNYIQNRAGSKTVSETLTLDAVKKEKGFEMWLEDCRWADQIRWGDTEGLKKQGKNIPSVRDAFFTKGEPTHRLYVEYTNPNDDLGKTYGFQDKHKLFPYPYDALEVNKLLQQNPGWAVR